MTVTWAPKLEGRGKPLYQAIVRALSDEIATGSLPSEYRLPTHRELADVLGVAIGTVTRAYAEAEKRGLIRGEGRRGTFVGESPTGRSALSSLLESGSRVIDLSWNYPSGDGHPNLSAVLRRLARRSEVQQLLRYPPPAGYEHHRAAGAKWIATQGMKVDPSSLLITNGAQHALAAIFASIASPGDAVLTEEHTYPGMKAIAEMYRLRLIGVPTDVDGPLPDAIESICRQKKVCAIYSNPTLHNPTNIIVSESRRREIAAVAERHDVAIVEDAILRRLVTDPPSLISSLAPDRSYLVASVSKLIAGGLRVGFVVAPPLMRQMLVDTLRATTLMTSPIPLEIAATWIEDGTAEKVVMNRRREARARQHLVSEILDGHKVNANPVSYHAWLQLPEGWTSTDFVMEAHRHGVATAPAEMFAVEKDKSVNAVRLCLGAPESRGLLRTGLEILAEILRGSPGRSAGTI